MTVIEEAETPSSASLLEGNWNLPIGSQPGG
jgi:hypothetical protein